MEQEKFYETVIRKTQPCDECIDGGEGHTKESKDGFCQIYCTICMEVLSYRKEIKSAEGTKPKTVREQQAASKKKVEVVADINLDEPRISDILFVGDVLRVLAREKNSKSTLEINIQKELEVKVSEDRSIWINSVIVKKEIKGNSNILCLINYSIYLAENFDMVISFNKSDVFMSHFRKIKNAYLVKAKNFESIIYVPDRNKDIIGKILKTGKCTPIFIDANPKQLF